MVRDTEIKRQQYSELYKRASELETERRVLLGSTRLVSLAEPPNSLLPQERPVPGRGFHAGADLLASGRTAGRSGSIRVENQTRFRRRRRLCRASGSVSAAAPSDEPPSDQPDPPLPPTRKSHLPEVADVLHILACLPRLKTLRQLSAVGAILQDYRHLTIPQALRLASEDGEFHAHAPRPRAGARDRRIRAGATDRRDLSRRGRRQDY